MKPRSLVAVPVLSVPAALEAQASTPTYATADYCESVSEAGGGSYRSDAIRLPQRR